MKWYPDLFLGSRASLRADEIIRDAAQGCFDRELRLITLAPNGIDQLNIIRPWAVIGRRAALAHMELIIGIALGEEEALDVVAAIAKASRMARGDCDMRRYIADEMKRDAGGHERLEQEATR